MTHQRMRD